MMDTSKEYIKMCDCPEIQGKIKYDRCSFWARPLINGKYSVWCGYHSPRDIWLPRQDQIQEMIKTNILDLLNKFYKYVFDDLSWMFNKDHTIKFNSMEQLWLAFYMYEKHGKIWNGEKWLKNL